MFGLYDVLLCFGFVGLCRGFVGIVCVLLLNLCVWILCEIVVCGGVCLLFDVVDYCLLIKGFVGLLLCG